MKLINVSSAIEGAAADHFRGQKFTEADLDFVAREDTTVLKPDGSVLFKLIKRCLPGDLIRQSFPIFGRFHDPPKNRQTASVGKSAVYRRKDGTIANTNMASPNDYPEIRRMSSVIIGYYDRSTRMPFCRACSYTHHHRDEFNEKVAPFTRAVSGVYAQHMPERYAAQEEAAKRTHQAWIIPGTVFSTITVNRNYEARAHKDAGDLPEGFGVMSVMRSGEYEGGITYWPGYRAGCFMDTGDLLLADVHEWHGVTDIKGKPGRYERISLIFYLRTKMCRCGSPAEELERAKNRQRGMPLYPDEPEPEEDADAEATTVP